MNPSHGPGSDGHRSPDNDPACSDEFSNDNDHGSWTPNGIEVDGLKNVDGEGNSVGVASNTDANSCGSKDADDSNKNSHATETGKDGTLSATEDSGNSDEAEPSQEKSLSADADSDGDADASEGNSSADAYSNADEENSDANTDSNADEENWSADADSNADEENSSADADSNADEENSSADADSNADEESSSADMDSVVDEENLCADMNTNTSDMDKKDRSPQVYVSLPTAEYELNDVKVVLSVPWALLHSENDYKLAYNCYYDWSKRDTDQDTGYYDLHFEVFHDNGGDFLNQLDSRSAVNKLTVLFDDRQLNLHWGRGFPARFGSADDHLGEDHPCVSMKEHIWKFLPEELVFKILLWLSPVVQSRFRTVCSKWKTVLSNQMALSDHYVEGRRLSCSIKANARARHVSVYCHSERKWFELPCMVAVRTLLVDPNNIPTRAIKATAAEIQTDTQCDRESLLKVTFDWELADVDGELFCYTSKEDKDLCKAGRTWVAVCNPMIPESSLLLPPIFGCLGPVSVKLLVDRQTKTFKVMTLGLWGPKIFDCVSFKWAAIQPRAGKWSYYRLHHFLQNGTVYGVADYKQLFVLDMVSKSWNEVEAELPCTKGRKFAITSSHDQVMLVEVNPKKKEYVRVWKLLTDAANDGPLFNAASWVKQKIVLPRSLKPLAWHFRTCWLSGGQFLFLNGGEVNQWISYDFSRRTWCVMPSRGRRIARLLWRQWEPGFDMDLKLD